ncbi:MAG: hypothetical protein U1F71_23315 [Verrucomicrobiaceae bacterium]
MKTISFQAFTDASCMVIFAPEAGLQITDEWLSCLNHITDPDGRTNLTCDYPAGAWPAIWQRNVLRMRELCSKGEFTLLLCDEVDHACRVSEGISEAETQRVRTRFEEWVYAPSGRLVIGDAMTAFSGEPMEKEPFAEIAVAPGWSQVTIHSLAEPVGFDHIEGFEGSEEYPEIVFCVRYESDRNSEQSATNLFPRVKTSYVRSVGGRCEAAVIGIEGNKAKLQLYTSKSTSCGYGRLIIPESDKIEVGESLLVRLREDHRAYWLVEKA